MHMIDSQDHATIVKDYIYTVQVSHKFNTTHLEHACDMHVTCTTKCNTTQGHAMIHVYDLMSVLMLLVI